MKAFPSLSGLILLPLSVHTPAYAGFTAHQINIAFLFHDRIRNLTYHPNLDSPLSS